MGTDVFDIGVIGSGGLAVAIAKRIEEIFYGHEDTVVPKFYIDKFNQTSFGVDTAAEAAKSRLVVLSMPKEMFHDIVQKGQIQLSEKQGVLSFIESLTIEEHMAHLSSPNIIRAVSNVAFEYGSALSAYTFWRGCSDERIDDARRLLNFGGDYLLHTTEDKLGRIGSITNTLLAISVDVQMQLEKVVKRGGFEEDTVRHIIGSTLASSANISNFNGSRAGLLEQILRENPDAKACVDHVRGSGGIEILERMLLSNTSKATTPSQSTARPATATKIGAK
jgi:pyrroline-5-carboxylate reductase